MRILTVLTYYRPHTSGLTIYAERLAQAFVRRGHQVTVMTTQYDPLLPREEMMDGVRVIRVPVALRISKGVLAPTFGLVSTKLVWENDIVQLHLPQFDAPGVALRARLFGKPSLSRIRSKTPSSASSLASPIAQKNAACFQAAFSSI